MGHDSTYLWQSFNHPTDTILPTQILNQGSKLVVRFLEVNRSSGRSMIILHTNLNLVPYTIDFLMDLQIHTPNRIKQESFDAPSKSRPKEF